MLSGIARVQAQLRHVALSLSSKNAHPEQVAALMTGLPGLDHLSLTLDDDDAKAPASRRQELLQEEEDAYDTDDHNAARQGQGRRTGNRDAASSHTLVLDLGNDALLQPLSAPTLTSLEFWKARAAISAAAPRCHHRGARDLRKLTVRCSAR